MRTLIIAEHDGTTVKPSTLNTITAGKLLGAEIDVLVAGKNCTVVANQLATATGVTRVLCAQDQKLDHFLAEPMADLILGIADSYTHILAPATTFGKNILPRVAAKLDVMQISDITKILSSDTFERPIYAGNAIATLQSMDSIKVMTVRPTAFASTDLGQPAVPISSLSPALPEYTSQFNSAEVSSSERPELTSARVVVSGGRGLQNGENFRLIEELADCLHGAIGASRAAVDAGFVPNDYQVGQTGKVVAPDLYIAIGISGAIQHLAGMKESKIIVAINKDPDAPIFQIADYGLVGDLFEIVPQLTQAIREIRK